MRILFAGTPEFAVPTLRALLGSTHEVVAVYTQPDRPAGRGQQLQLSPVKQLALEQGIPVFQPLTLRDSEEQAKIAALKLDLLIVVAYGLILPKAVLALPRLGCINVHASLLPRWRGAAPIQHAILAGDRETGVTIMQMEAGLDTGPMLSKITTAIVPEDTSASLHDRLSELGAQALLLTLSELESGHAKPIAQDDGLATHAGKIQKSDAAIDWSLPAVVLERQIRAYFPWPISYFQIDGLTCRVFQARAEANATVTALPGTILDHTATSIRVATGAGLLILERLQLPGGKNLSVSDILHARASLFAPGVRLT